MSDRRELVRSVVEDCWSDPAGIERMRALLADGYVHHTGFGDWTFEQFLLGLEWVASQFVLRTYRVDHIVLDGDLAAAYFHWSGTRTADGSAVDGRGAYHCRFAGDRICEDWDVIFPSS